MGVMRTPEKDTLEQIKNAGLEPQPKRKRGRPKGSKNAPGTAKRALTRIDPETGIAVTNVGQNALIMGRMGDERVTAFVRYHMDMMQMRQGCDKKNVPDLYNRFYRYLAYCAEKGIIPNNMNAYYAIGLIKQDVSDWSRGVRGTPEHKAFAEDIMSFFASIHEQAGGESIVNPILSIYWSKAHDNMSDQPKIELEVKDALGDKRSSAQIAQQYSDILPEDD